MCKVIKKYLDKWWFWLIVCIVFLVAVQVMFSILAPCKWLEAAWEAGDLITFVGTVSLGFVAWKQSQMANSVSKELIKLQSDEYMPVITVTNFIGKSIGQHLKAIKLERDITIAKIDTEDDDIILGYSINVVDENVNIDKDMYLRMYELQLKYLGKINVSSLIIKSVTFKGHEIRNANFIDKPLDISLVDQEEFSLFISCISNEDFLNSGTRANKNVIANELIVEFEIKSISNKTYMETMKIRKFFVNEPGKKFKGKDVELLVSKSYNIREN